MEKFYGFLITHCILVFFIFQFVHYSLLFFAAHFIERIAVSVTCLLIILITFRFTRKWGLQDEIDSRKKAVLITGCDSGFGFLLAQRLDRKGFKVFASCLDPCGPGANELKTLLSEQSKVFGLDVTKAESTQHALSYVQENLGSCELWAIVNNAGVRKGFSIELSSIQDFEDNMNVNALGHVRITKAFLNLLRPSKGRIINVNSISSRMPISNIIAYCMSKHAAAGFNDCLRLELANTGIKVISVEALAFQSPMTDGVTIKKNLERKITEAKEEIMENYGKGYIENFRKHTELFVRNVSKDVHIAINDLEHAVCCKYPESIYTTSPTFFQLICMKILPLLPPFIQDGIYYIVPRLHIKLLRL